MSIVKSHLIIAVVLTFLSILLFKPQSALIARADRLAAVSELNPAAIQTCQQYAPIDMPKSIIDNSITTSTVSIATNFVVEDLNIRGIMINHTWTSDLKAYVTSPGGTRIKLFANTGGSGDHFIDTDLDDSAEADIQVSEAPFHGVYRPLEPLSTFNGEAALGNWRLSIEDINPGDDGTLVEWQLEFCLVSDAPTGTPIPTLPSTPTPTPMPPTSTSTPIVVTKTHTPVPPTSTSTSISTIPATQTYTPVAIATPAEPTATTPSTTTAIATPTSLPTVTLPPTAIATPIAYKTPPIALNNVYLPFVTR